MLSCDCPREVVTIVLQLPLHCIHNKEKARKKEIQAAIPRARVGLCDDCKDQTRASDEGMVTGANLYPDCVGH